MTVITAVELEDLVSAGVATSQTDGAHGGFGSGGDHAHHFNVRISVADHLGQLCLAGRGCAERSACCRCFLNGFNNLGVAMAQNHWSPGTDIIYIGVIVGVENFRTSGPRDEDWLTANRLECPDRAVNTTRDHLLCLGKKVGRFLVVHGGSLKNLLALGRLTASTGLCSVTAGHLGSYPLCRSRRV